MAEMVEMVEMVVSANNLFELFLSTELSNCQFATTTTVSIFPRVCIAPLIQGEWPADAGFQLNGINTLSPRLTMLNVTAQSAFARNHVVFAIDVDEPFEGSQIAILKRQVLDPLLSHPLWHDQTSLPIFSTPSDAIEWSTSSSYSIGLGVLAAVKRCIHVIRGEENTDCANSLLSNFILAERLANAWLRSRASAAATAISSTSWVTGSHHESEGSSSSSRCIEWPDQTRGMRVFEFFSGIGGMRLALPEVIRGRRIEQITAFDCSDTANKVYKHNFHSEEFARTNGIPSQLNAILIDGLKTSDVDGKCHIWTMSPPCQPYTTTRGAHRRDQADNRSKGIFHIMFLLRTMRQRPIFIVLENVQGFFNSRVLREFKDCLTGCGYLYRQYCLDPLTSVGLPNHRSRYYLIAEHSSSPMALRLVTGASSSSSSSSGMAGDDQGGGVDVGVDERGGPGELRLSRDDDDDVGGGGGGGGEEVEDNEEESSSGADLRGHEEGTEIEIETETETETETRIALCDDIKSTESQAQEEDQVLFRSLPPSLSSQYSNTPLTIGELLQPVRTSELLSRTLPTPLSSLYVPNSILAKPWAATRLSVVGNFDQRTYCFTKSYGRLFDKSSGSLFLDDATGPLSNPSHAIDRTDMMTYSGRIRRFHPTELLVLFGFPSNFQFPADLSADKMYACIGNSVNVRVVNAVMKCLFDETINL